MAMIPSNILHDARTAFPQPRLTPAPADSSSAASLRAWFAKNRAGVQTSLARIAAAAYANRWALEGYNMSPKNIINPVCYAIILLAFLNFFVFSSNASRLGGDAFAGKVENGQY